MEAMLYVMNQLPPKVRNLKGQQFGRLTARKFIELKRDGAVWECECSCGSITTVRAGDLKSGNTKSCGCQRSEVARKLNTKHGVTSNLSHDQYPKTYKIWRGIVNRCCTPSCSSFHNYGGRGILVCEAWRNSYQVFLDDMGECPPGFSIERIDVDGHYEPGNCKWIELEEQGKNRRNTVWVELNGEKMIQADAAKRLGLHPATLCDWHRGRCPKPSHVDLVFLQAVTQ